MPHWGLAEWAAAGGVVIAACALLAFVFDRIGRPTRLMIKKFEEFEGDWYGRSARPGFKATPGIPERLERIEDAQVGGTDRLGNIEAQLRTNGGGTLRDEIIKIRDRLDEHLRFHSVWPQQPPTTPPTPPEGTPHV